MTRTPGAGTTGTGTSPQAWGRRRDALAKRCGTATAHREVSEGRTLPLAYVRTPARGSSTVLVIPGGPGLASVKPYQRFRAAAVRRGLDVLMVEHRGVGMSRRTDDGEDLRPEDITVRDVVDDLAAVLDAEGIEQVLVYGSSYGSYLAGAFGALHADRVEGMILDSPVLDGQSRHDTARELNRLYWNGTPTTAEHASRVRSLVEHGVIRVEDSGFPIQLLHESGGPQLVDRMLSLLERGTGARMWSWLNRLGASDVMDSRPFLMEFDLVARSAFVELGYGLAHDPASGPLRSDESLSGLAEHFPPFSHEPVDVRGALSQFDWPVLVLSGDRDIRTPRSVAEHVTTNAPDAVLLPIAEHGHSALDTAQPLALEAMAHLADSTAAPSSLDPGRLRARRSAIARLISFQLMIATMLPKGAR